MKRYHILNYNLSLITTSYFCADVFTDFCLEQSLNDKNKKYTTRQFVTQMTYIQTVELTENSILFAE
jgi:hypothetical protein